MPSKVPETDKLLYELRVELQGIKPPIWRVLQVPSRTSLLKFHRILQLAMGWTNSHLHLFEVDGKQYGEPDPDWDIEILDSRKMTLNKIFSGGKTSFLYEYDMGDGWRHRITLLGKAEGATTAKHGCTAGARACPPEDCGGPPGYDDLLIALSDPHHEQHDDMLEWVGGKFDPDAFDAAKVDRALKRLR